jgi:hypothetical protein
MERYFRNCTSFILQCSMRWASGQLKWRRLLLARGFAALETGARISHEALARFVEKSRPDPPRVLLRLTERTVPFTNAMRGNEAIFDHDTARTGTPGKSSCISVV